MEPIPGILLRTLAGAAGNTLDWDKIHRWWTDERVVEPTNEASNFAAINKDLLQVRAIPTQYIHRVKGEITPKVAGQLYGIEMVEVLARNSSSIPYFDLVVLGMGTDGHVASLFPDKTHEEPHPWVSTVKHEGLYRVSLSYEVILASLQIAYLVTGSNKAQVVQDIVTLSEKGKKLPGGIIWEKRPNAHWFLDSAATKLIA